MSLASLFEKGHLLPECVRKIGQPIPSLPESSAGNKTSSCSRGHAATEVCTLGGSFALFVVLFCCRC